MMVLIHVIFLLGTLSVATVAFEFGGSMTLLVTVPLVMSSIITSAAFAWHELTRPVKDMWQRAHDD